VRPAGLASRGPRDNRLLEAAKFMGEQATPISFTPSPSAGPGSKINGVEKFFGLRQAPGVLEDPQRRADLQRKYGGKAWDQKLRADARAKAAREAPAPAPVAESAVPSWAAGVTPAWASAPTVKAGAADAGSLRPEMKPIVAFIGALPEFDRITAENDSYHPASDVHGQGRAVDFTIKGGKKNAPAFANRLRQKLEAEGFKVRVLDEYTNPSARATGGHIHVQLQ
jgi:hypothetical protein